MKKLSNNSITVLAAALLCSLFVYGQEKSGEVTGKKPETKPPAVEKSTKTAKTEKDAATVAKPEQTSRQKRVTAHEREILELKEKLEKMNDRIGAADVMMIDRVSVGGSRKLKEMERKALEYNALKVRDEIKTVKLEGMSSELKHALITVDDQAARIKELESITNRLSMTIAKLELEQQPLKDAIKAISKGQYEYYEVQEGDTCETIAAKASVYGDSTKHVLIRQANRHNVEDLDKLEPGFMLIIPHFELKGNYEF